jgi:hypothetical protein
VDTCQLHGFARAKCWNENGVLEVARVVGRNPLEWNSCFGLDLCYVGVFPLPDWPRTKFSHKLATGACSSGRITTGYALLHTHSLFQFFVHFVFALCWNEVVVSAPHYVGKPYPKFCPSKSAKDGKAVQLSTIVETCWIRIRFAAVGIAISPL